MAQTKWIEITGYLKWARVFEENRDLTSTNKKVQKAIDAADGFYKVTVFPATQEDLDKVKAELSDKLYGGADRFKTDEDGYGVGVGFELRRKHSDKKEFEQKDGTTKEFDFGGPPSIVWWNDEMGKGTLYTIQDDGLIGNGSLAKVKFTSYGEPKDDGATVRLEKLGIIDRVVYDNGNVNGDGF